MEFPRSTNPKEARNLIKGACETLQIMKRANCSLPQGSPDAFTEQQMDEYRRHIPFLFIPEETREERSTFFSTGKAKVEIFQECPRCHRNLHFSVVDAVNGCYSCQRGDTPQKRS